MAAREWSVMRAGDDAGDDTEEFVIIDDTEYDPDVVCTVHQTNEHSSFTAKENARLIAAAPDLLAACEEAFEEFTKNRYGSGGSPQLSKLDAAIAKAKGVK